MTDIDEVGVLLSARAGMYRTFQNAFGNEPTKDMLEGLSGHAVKSVCEVFDGAQGRFHEALPRFFDAVDTCLEGQDEALEALEGRFTRLFVGPGATEGNPWESFYLSKDKALRQGISLEVRRAYVEQGLIPRAYPTVSDDHVALELDFVARLAQRAQQAWASGDAAAAVDALDASEAFLQAHLSRWVNLLCDALAAAKHGSFLYFEAAEVLAAFIEIDFDLMVELKEAMSA